MQPAASNECLLLPKGCETVCDLHKFRNGENTCKVPRSPKHMLKTGGYSTAAPKIAKSSTDYLLPSKEKATIDLTANAALMLHRASMKVRGSIFTVYASFLSWLTLAPPSPKYPARRQPTHSRFKRFIHPLHGVQKGCHDLQGETKAAIGATELSV